LEIVTEGNEGNVDPCGTPLAVFTEGDEGNGDPCETMVFYRRERRSFFSSQSFWKRGCPRSESKTAAAGGYAINRVQAPYMRERICSFFVFKSAA
jgi:hypothetical protein